MSEKIIADRCRPRPTPTKSYYMIFKLRPDPHVDRDTVVVGVYSTECEAAAVVRRHWAAGDKTAFCRPFTSVSKQPEAKTSQPSL